MFSLEKIVEIVFKIFHKGISLYTKNRYEYKNVSDYLTETINRIDDGINALRTRDLKASLTHLKIALLALKFSELNIMTDNINKELYLARNLAILAFDTLDDVVDKITVTKIIIATSFLLFDIDNEQSLIISNIHVALERLLKIKTVKYLIESEY